jgi:hypothetical protein
MLVSRRQLGRAKRRAVARTKDSFSEEKVPHETGDQEVLTKEFLEELRLETVPSDGISDGSEDPVEFTKRRASLTETSSDLINLFRINAFDDAARAVPVEGHTDGSGETSSKDISRELWVERERLVLITSSEEDDFIDGLGLR